MKYRFILLLLFSNLSNLRAQQTSLFALYRDAWSVINPAVISNNYLLNNRTMSLSSTGRDRRTRSRC